MARTYLPDAFGQRDCVTPVRGVWRTLRAATAGRVRVLGNRMEMAHSVEGRVPFLDHHVVECVCRAPVSLKIRGVTEKYLLREASKPLITETVYRRQKHPFLSPPVTTVPAERFHEMMQDTLRGPILASLPFYDQKKVVALLDRLPAMSRSDHVGW